MTNQSGEIVQKRFQLLHDLVPNAKVFGFLVNPDNTANVAAAEAAVRTWGVSLVVEQVRSERDFDVAFASLARRGVEALATQADGLFVSAREPLVRIIAQHALPTMHIAPEAVRAGGLTSYGASPAPIFRQVGVYAGRILKTEKPADLPVLQPTKFEFVINLKTAKALGLTINPGLLAIVDEVIE
jgi:putative ABC transport system substrate-binding protein